MSKEKTSHTGDGSFHKRSSTGYWERTITVGYDPHTGKRIRKTVTGKTKGIVNEKLAKLKAETVSGVSPTAGKVRVGQFLNDWLEGTAKLNVRPSTYARYESLVRNHVVPVLGGHQLKTLNPLEIQGFIATLVKREQTPQTIKHAFAVLKIALNHAVSLNLLGRNPCSGTKLPTVRNRKILVLSEGETARFLAAAKDHRLYALFLLVVTLGLRQGEAFALHWDDLDLANRVLHVRHTLQELKADLSLVEPKTERSRRTLELPEHLVEALEAHRGRMVTEGIDGPWVFTDTQGGPLRKSNFLRRDYYPLLAQSGIDREKRPFTFHDLRHTAATLMLSRGVPLLEVSEILGHEDEGFTLRTYAHVLPSMRRAATQKIEGFFRELLGSESPTAT